MIAIFIILIGSADRPGNELQSIRREEDLREGRISNETDPEHKRVGAFEKHTKVISFKFLIVLFYLIIGYRTTFIRTIWMA